MKQYDWEKIRKEKERNEVIQKNHFQHENCFLSFSFTKKFMTMKFCISVEYFVYWSDEETRINEAKKLMKFILFF